MARRRKNPDDTMKVVLYGGAAALAAYLLFLRKKENEADDSEMVFTKKEVLASEFLVKLDPGGGRQCFRRDSGAKAPLVECEGLGSLGHSGMGSLGG